MWFVILMSGQQHSCESVTNVITVLTKVVASSAEVPAVRTPTTVENARSRKRIEMDVPRLSIWEVPKQICFTKGKSSVSKNAENPCCFSLVVRVWRRENKDQCSCVILDRRWTTKRSVKSRLIRTSTWIRHRRSRKRPAMTLAIHVYTVASTRWTVTKTTKKNSKKPSKWIKTSSMVGLFRCAEIEWNIHDFFSFEDIGQEKATIGFDDDVKITPFNIDEEMEEGHYDESGTFHWKKKDVKITFLQASKIDQSLPTSDDIVCLSFGALTYFPLSTAQTLVSVGRASAWRSWISPPS